jgi:predicted  nucleic acid-binding Zn-ribbon protein
VEKEQNALLLRQIQDSEIIYKQHIDELEKAIQEHVEASETYESQLDERDEALLKAGSEIASLNKEIVDLRQESENVVSKWQGKTRIIRKQHFIYSF